MLIETYSKLSNDHSLSATAHVFLLHFASIKSVTCSDMLVSFPRLFIFLATHYYFAEKRRIQIVSVKGAVTSFNTRKPLLAYNVIHYAASAESEANL